MLKYITRNFFIIIIAIYSFYKILNTSPKTRHICLLNISFSIITSICSTFLFHEHQAANWIFILFLYFLFMKLTTNIPIISIYIPSLLSFSISFIHFNLATVIAVVVLLPFYYGKYELPLFLTQLFICLIQVFLTYICFHIPRLKKGMKFLYNLPSRNIGSTICILIFVWLIMFCQAKLLAEPFMILFSTIIILFSFLLIYWWNYHITQTYRKFLRKNELDSLNLLLEERDQKILYLKNQNDELARLIHKDNKIIPALTSAIMESYESKTTLDLTKWETDSPLCLKLKQLYDERVNMLETYHNEDLNLPKTGFDSINATLSFMHSEASKSGIPFQIVLYDNLNSTISDEITEDDFNHLLSDLLINAINACKNCSSGSIQIYLGKTEDISIIKICNTGSVFHLETLKNLGLARHTTHADTGGSGIGLMDIWKIKEKYKATLLIDEIANTSSSETYTCMNILFNRKNHFMIESDRYKELATYINRPDVMIISQN